MSRYTITTLCSVLWYMCVLLTWMRISQEMKLFADHTPHGWLMIFLAFLASAALNFVLNPLMWVVAGCYIHEAKNENRKSRWQFYPGLFGVALLVAGLAAVFGNVKVPVKLFQAQASQEVAGAAGPSGRRAPQVSGIMFSESEPKALVDGYVLKEGEELDGFVVDKISETSVTFEGPDGTMTVRRVK